MIQNQLAALRCSARCGIALGLEEWIPLSALTCIDTVCCTCFVELHQVIPGCNIIHTVFFHQVTAHCQNFLTKLVGIARNHVDLSVNLCLLPCHFRNNLPDIRCIRFDKVLRKRCKSAEGNGLLVMAPARCGKDQVKIFL